MRMEQLICLVEISKHKSLNDASEQLHMTQQALSSSMKTLENELGVQILLRTRRGCVLTGHGKKLLDFAEDILPRYHALCSDFAGKRSFAPPLVFEGSLHIYVSSVFYLSQLSHVIKQICEKQPKLKVVILAHSPAQICAKLITAPVDGVHRIGFVNTPCREGGTPDKDYFVPVPGVRFHPLAKGRYVACVSKDSPLALQSELSIQTLLKYPLVIGASDDSNHTPLHLLLAGYGTPHIALSVASLQVWNQAVASNVGVGFLHSIFLEDSDYMQKYVHDMVLIPIREKLMAVTGYLVTENPGPVVEWFIRCLHQPAHTGESPGGLAEAYVNRHTPS